MSDDQEAVGTEGRRRPLAGQRALVTGATLYVDGGMTLYPEFRTGG